MATQIKRTRVIKGHPENVSLPAAKLSGWVAFAGNCPVEPHSFNPVAFGLTRQACIRQAMDEVELRGHLELCPAIVNCTQPKDISECEPNHVYIEPYSLDDDFLYFFIKNGEIIWDCVDSL